MKQIHLFHLTAVAALCAAGPARADAPPVEDVVSTYADIAQAGYTDSLDAARTLDTAVDALLDEPSAETLAAAREAWLAARVPYQQSEVFRFGNPIVDDWEGRVNAWPLDEGLIDYVDASYGADSDDNEFYTANVVANETLEVNGRTIDASEITPAVLQDELQEAGGIESNVATGYHAIEFLLWGQDLNGAGPGAGTRPATDYDVENCTVGNCERRGEYLSAASRLLVDDLEEMVTNWKPGGMARDALVDVGATGGLKAMLAGMGSLSYGELAGERMQLGLMLHDPEEEHDCFSDNTAMSHYLERPGHQERLARAATSAPTAASRRRSEPARSGRRARTPRSPRSSRASSTRASRRCTRWSRASGPARPTTSSSPRATRPATRSCRTRSTR